MHQIGTTNAVLKYHYEEQAVQTFKVNAKSRIKMEPKKFRLVIRIEGVEKVPWKQT